MFEDYPDIVDLKLLCQMLGGVGPKTAYKLLHSGSIRSFRIGRGFRIPKICVIEFFQKEKPI